MACLLDVQCLCTEQCGTASPDVIHDNAGRQAAPHGNHHVYRAQADWVAEVLPKLEHYTGITPQDDAGWLAGRLAELLSLKASQRQSLLEMDDPVARLDRVTAFINAAS